MSSVSLSASRFRRLSRFEMGAGGVLDLAAITADGGEPGLIAVMTGPRIVVDSVDLDCRRVSAVRRCVDQRIE